MVRSISSLESFDLCLWASISWAKDEVSTCGGEEGVEDQALIRTMDKRRSQPDRVIAVT